MTDDPPLRTNFGEVTLERLEQGVADAAFIVQTFGPQYVGIFDRLERDLNEFRMRQDPVVRARAWLAKGGDEGAKAATREIGRPR